jgi:hypothetical protein
MENPTPPPSQGFPKRRSQLPDSTSLRSLVGRIGKTASSGHFRDVLIQHCHQFEANFFANGELVQGLEAHTRKILVFVAQDRLARLCDAYRELHASGDSHQIEGPCAKLSKKWKEIEPIFRDYEQGMRWIRTSEEKEGIPGSADPPDATKTTRLFLAYRLFATLRAEIEGPWSLPLFNQYGQFYSGFYLLSPLDQTFFPTQTVTTLARLGHGWATYQKWRDMLALEATPGHDGHDLVKLIAAYKVQLEKADPATKAVFAKAHVEHTWISALHDTPYGDLQALLHSLSGPIGEPQQTAWRTFVDRTNQINDSKWNAFGALPKVRDEIHLLRTFFERYEDALAHLPADMSGLFHRLYHGLDGPAHIRPLLQPYIDRFGPFGLAEEIDQHAFGETVARLQKPGHSFHIANPAWEALRTLDKTYFAAKNDASFYPIRRAQVELDRRIQLRQTQRRPDQGSSAHHGLPAPVLEARLPQGVGINRPFASPDRPDAVVLCHGSIARVGPVFSRRCGDIHHRIVPSRSRFAALSNAGSYAHLVLRMA